MDNEKDLNEGLEEVDNNIVTLKDEEGNDVDFEFLDLIEYEGENYVVLLPADEEAEDSDEVVILKEEPSDDNSEEETYGSVEDETILNKIFEIFKEKFKDEFNFVDEEE